MITFNIETGKARQNGQMQIYIRVTKDKNHIRVKIPIFATASDLDKKGKVVNNLLLLSINDRLDNMRKRLLELGSKADSMPLDGIVRYITDELEDTSSNKVFRLDFIKFGRKHIESLKKDGRGKTASAYNTALNNFCLFLGKESIDISEVKKDLLIRYEDWFKEHDFGVRAWELYMSELQALHNLAKNKYNDEDNDVVVIKGSPFAKMRFKRTKAELRMVEKRALSVDAIRSIIELPTIPGHYRANMAKDVFLFSFCCCGMNAIDIYEHDGGLKDGNLEFYRHKTARRSGEDSFISINMPDEAKWFVDEYKGLRHTFIFKEQYNTSDIFNAALRKGLHDMAVFANKYYGRDVLPENLNFYAARHSWSTIAANDCGIPTQVVDKALCHVVDSVAVQSYIKRDFKDVNAANRKVIDFVFTK